MTNPYDNYLESQVLAANPVELVQILYRAAIDSLESARRQLAGGDLCARARSVSRALSILAELTHSLDRDRGGELATNLVSLYDYILRTIHQANTQGNDAAFLEAIRLLSTLLEAWQSISVPDPQPPFAGAELRESIHLSA